MEELIEIKKSLNKHGQHIALRHLQQVEETYEQGNWEACNSQIRTFLEALFNAVAFLRLDSSSKDGAARKKLLEKKIITERESKFIQSFMELAGENGSHSGVSNEIESKSRLYGLISISIFGISLLPDHIRVEDVLPKAKVDIKDSKISIKCPTCESKQFLSEAYVSRNGKDTIYECKNGCQPLVIIGTPGSKAKEGRGYRLGDHVIRNANDLLIEHIGVLIPKSHAALIKDELL